MDPGAETVEQYVLGGETYTLRMKPSMGELASVAVAVPVQALFDDAANVETLRALLA